MKGLSRTQSIPPSPPLPSPMIDVRYVRGVSLEDPTAPWQLYHSYALEQRQVITPTLGGGGEVRVLDDQGNTLYSTTFVTDTIGSGEMVALYSVQVPVFANEDEIQVLKNGVLQDSITRSTNAPQVTVSSPLPGQTLTTTLHVDWSAADADGDTLMSSVLFSHDQERWTSLRTLIFGEATTYDVSYLPSCSSCTVRVMVTDGMNTTTTDIAGLKVTPNRAPTVHIMTPQDGEIVLSGTNIVFQGIVSDQEDGEIMAEGDDLSVVWSSSIDGVVGTGTSFNSASLSVGVHTLTLTATDSGGAFGSDVVTVTVVP